MSDNKFAVVGFTGAGKTTYAASLYRAMKGSGYEVLSGEDYLKRWADSLDNMPATQKGRTPKITFKGCSDGCSETFTFCDYAGEETLQGSCGDVTPKFVSTIIGNCVGVLMLVNPKSEEGELEKDGIDGRLKKYDSILDCVFGSDTIRAVFLVRTATDYFDDMEKESKGRFRDFEEKLQNKLEELSKKSLGRVKVEYRQICCSKSGRESSQKQLFTPFDHLIQACKCDRGGITREDELDAPVESVPSRKFDTNRIWVVALIVLVIVAGALCLMFCLSNTKGEEETGPTPDPPPTKGFSPLPQSRRCAQCQSEIGQDIDGVLCETCQQRNREKEDRGKAISKFDGALEYCQEPIGQIRLLNELSDVVPSADSNLQGRAEMVSSNVQREYQRILDGMESCYASIEEQLAAVNMTSGLFPFCNGKMLDESFQAFCELSSALRSTRNDTLKNCDWRLFLEEGYKRKQFGGMCADSYKQTYEITNVSVLVSNNPYRTLKVALSLFQPSENKRDLYEITAFDGEYELLYKKECCDWKNVWSGSVSCTGCPWRCCGVQLHFKGDNWLSGKAVRCVAKVFNDDAHCIDDGGCIEGGVDFGTYGDKGSVNLRYRVSYRRVDPSVISPFSMRGAK